MWCKHSKSLVVYPEEMGNGVLGCFKKHQQENTRNMKQKQKRHRDVPGPRRSSSDSWSLGSSKFPVLRSQHGGNTGGDPGRMSKVWNVSTHCQLFEFCSPLSKVVLARNVSFPILTVLWASAGFPAYYFDEAHRCTDIGCGSGGESDNKGCYKISKTRFGAFVL